MANIDPPSFSLGLDLEPEPEFQRPIQEQHYSPINPSPSSSTLLNNDDDDNFGYEVMDSDSKSGPSSPRVFKRLRKGPVIRPRPGPVVNGLKKDKEEMTHCDDINKNNDNGDDDIEEFSSQDDIVIRDACPSVDYTSVCSSSKVPLHASGVLMTRSSNQLKGNKETTKDVPSSSCLRTVHSGLMFPNLTVSPLRRFQLIDSDSDEPSMSEDIGKKIPKKDLSMKDHQPASCEQKQNPSAEKHQNEDLWKDFTPIKSFNIPTPALDEVCAEYFHSVQDKNSVPKVQADRRKVEANIFTGFEQSWNSADPAPPAHCYFLHDDSRIQSLVRHRLPNFSPLGIMNMGNHQSSESFINYMGQFNGEASKKGVTQENNNVKASTRGRNRSKKSNVKETHASEEWVDPKRSTAVPKDAGKRRVQANGQGVGHWYTSPEGVRVYVTKTGQEFTGQMAYRAYKRENGGFRKSKKKTNAKRKKS